MGCSDPTKGTSGVNKGPWPPGWQNQPSRVDRFKSIILDLSVSGRNQPTHGQLTSLEYRGAWLSGDGDLGWDFCLFCLQSKGSEMSHLS